WRRRSESLRDQLRETVQQEVGRKRLVPRRRRRADGPRDLAERSDARKLARGQGGAPGLEIRLARKADVEGLEPPRRLKQLRCRTPEARGRRDPPSQQIDACAVKLVQRPRFGCSQHCERRLERTGLEARLCRRQRALGAPYR